MTGDRDTRRLMKQGERDRRLADLYQAYPELKRLDEALAAAGREGLLAIWQGQDYSAVTQRLTEIQAQKKRLLAALGLDEAVYDAEWDCPLCQDRGYVRPGEICGCRRADGGRRRLLESGLTPAQRRLSFDNFLLDWYERPAEVGRLAEWLQGFAGRLIRDEAPGNVFLFGPVGNGKTHLCCAVANCVLATGKTVLYRRTEDLLEELRDELYGRGDRGEYRGRERLAETGRPGGPGRPEYPGGQSSPAVPVGTAWPGTGATAEMAAAGSAEGGLGVGRGQLQERLLTADLLILEDLGTERLTDFAEERLTSLIDRRISWQKPWIITSNLIGDQFTGRYDARLVDRVLGESRRLYLKENSIRFKKAQSDKAGG